MAESKGTTEESVAEYYTQAFKPREYLDKHFSSFDGTDGKECVQLFIMNNLHQTLGSGAFQGKRLLDIGTGPSILSVLSASKYFSDITCSDYLEVCREELQKWVDGDPDAFDWGAYFRYVSKLEGNSSSPDDIAPRLRKSIKGVVHCDVKQSNPLCAESVDPFDVVVSSFCLELACDTPDQYRAGVGNMTSLVKHGGGLVILGDFKNNIIVETEKYADFDLNEAFLRDALVAHGCTDIEIRQVSMVDEWPCEFFHATARKV
ncbi:nicotinamide N-methyltransferase-like [Branchiostoma floridae]|uniref:Nicotinamide N-methyltransferase-like n=1 Tax=Branchiostoma floridae TaxID=7739 RepID=A0A9J7N1B3_BRAFL|nr:nicotinamide N-methyltransferase-like [Branchiostoma floridae]